MLNANAYWRHRAETYGPGWVEHYWQDWRAPHRMDVAEAIETCGPFRSILEVGCHCGPNLRLWRARWPDVTLMGVDVSPQAVRFGQRQFLHDAEAHLWLEDYLSAPYLPMADVICTCYSAAYCAPAALPNLLEQMWRSTRRAIILAEPMALDGLPVGPCKDDIEEWRHDYVMALTDLGARQLEVCLVNPPADGMLNGIVIARKGS